MTLGINTAMSDGETTEFMPIVKYSAESGRFYKIDREGGSNGYESVPTELLQNTRFIADFGTINVGWILFSAGAAPSLAIVPLGQPLPPRPSKDHRQGFRMLIHLGKQGGVREFSSASKTVTGAVDQLHTEFDAAPEARTGKVPVVEFQGAAMTQSKNIHGTKTLYTPRFKIVSWIERPADLGPRTVPPPGASTTPAQAPARSNGATQAQKPVRPVQAPQADPEWDTAAMTPQPGVTDDIDSEIPF